MAATPSRNPHSARQLSPGTQRRESALAFAFRPCSRLRQLLSHGVSTARAGNPATLMNVRWPPA